MYFCIIKITSIICFLILLICTVILLSDDVLETSTCLIRFTIASSAFLVFHLGKRFLLVALMHLGYSTELSRSQYRLWPSCIFHPLDLDLKSTTSVLSSIYCITLFHTFYTSFTLSLGDIPLSYTTINLIHQCLNSV